MQWYYSANGAQAGPVSQAEFDGLIQSGRIHGDTMVWREGMPNWVRYAELGSAGGGVAVAAGIHNCSECGRVFPESDMIRYENKWICGTCKPRFLQKLKEGVTPTGMLVYAGFWIRFGAKFIDGILLFILNRTLLTVLLPVLGYGQGSLYLIQLIAYLIDLSIVAFFNGKFGATPGKMALKLKIVRPDGQPITYARAAGRYVAELLSAFTLLIGYMMAGWDEQKRALHDRICDTRVIRTDRN